ncbi:hypothetical protein [Prescottella agglutinans]|uniref:Uncharacterized protein n=1 Tax=Prescottella agglutinans TaxID=1644129 RepID=A0ABT6MI91_9NOCA|nr:hypothetical protein [Prescottella agglutinans]MDH6284038.1 hypothetical protein [Prescottella agglutinans]
MVTTTRESTAAFTTEQVHRIDSHIRDLDREIIERCIEQQAVAGHALAVIANAAHPGVHTVRVHDIGAAGTWDKVVCLVGDRAEPLPATAAGEQIDSVLTAMFRRLPDGVSGPWSRSGRDAFLTVSAALALGDRYPFLPVHERLLAHVEKQTGRTIRRIEIGTELYENGYFYSEHIEVDYSDGDGDTVYVEDLNDFTDELRHWVGDPGPQTTVTIERTAKGITME